MKVLIQTSKATSLSEIGRQIAEVCERLGHHTVLNRDYPIYPRFRGVFDAAIFIYPFLPTWCSTYIYKVYVARKELQGRAVMYTMVEGLIKKPLIPEWVKKDFEVIANSRYSAERLQDAGIKVIDVIPHGVPSYEIEYALSEAPKYRKVIEEQFSDKVVFGVVARAHFRKGLDALYEAVKRLSEKRDNFVVLMITDHSELPKIQKVPNCYYVATFGGRLHREIMTFYAACDYLLHPAYNESFGLPVLEANAVGRPVIACKLPPFEEFADTKANIMFDYDDVELRPSSDGIYYELYIYDVQKLVDAMEYAIDIRLNKRDEYEDRCARVRERAAAFRSESLYQKLIEYLGEEPLDQDLSS